jgi:hypothetical protein
MQRFILSGLAVVLMSAMNTSNVLAQTTAYNQNINRSNITEVQPFNLAYLGYQGYFKKIPSAAAFVAGIKSGKVNAQTLIQSAIEQGRLSPETLNDEGYVNALEIQLREFLN